VCTYLTCGRTWDTEDVGPRRSQSVGGSLDQLRSRLLDMVWRNYRGRRRLGDRHHSPSVRQRWNGTKQHIGSASRGRVDVWTRVVTSHASD
jgi:hypothetical protein